MVLRSCWCILFTIVRIFWYWRFTWRWSVIRRCGSDISSFRSISSRTSSRLICHRLVGAKRHSPLSWSPLVDSARLSRRLIFSLKTKKFLAMYLASQWIITGRLSLPFARQARSKRRYQSLFNHWIFISCISLLGWVRYARSSWLITKDRSILWSILCFNSKLSSPDWHAWRISSFVIIMWDYSWRKSPAVPNRVWRSG